MKRSAFVAGILLILAGSAYAKVARTTLANLVSHSDLIIIGTVSSVEQDGQWQIARVAVTETLKGSPETELFFLASPTWTCDTSTAQPGEQALLFLSRPDPDPDIQPSPPTQFRGQPIFVISWSGRGRLPIAEIDGLAYATLSETGLILPADMPTITDPASPRFIRGAELQALREAVGTVIAEQ